MKFDDLKKQLESIQETLNLASTSLSTMGNGSDVTTLLTAIQSLQTTVNSIVNGLV